MLSRRDGCEIAWLASLHSSLCKWDEFCGDRAEIDLPLPNRECSAAAASLTVRGLYRLYNYIGLIRCRSSRYPFQVQIVRKGVKET